ncbi:hypothetical protein [Streptomyces chromofuscus]|uniref:hypothetical protein n=1 Tax=Streptomyces chromofuscus TaxID=42881 RepID=UPI001D15B20F|nr:hypothetical protein [Streptomyces chromofuscus]
MLERKRTSQETSKKRPNGPSVPASIRQFSDHLTQLPPSDERLDWRRGAACRRLPQHVVFTRIPSVAAPALRACNQCPIVAECETVVDPVRSWFDGVCAGRLWRNGRVVADCHTAAGDDFAPEGGDLHGGRADRVYAREAKAA